MINSVTAYADLKKRDSSTVEFTFLAEDGSDYSGPTESATQSYASYSYEMTTDPTTGSPWTVAEVNSWTQNFGIHRTTGVDRINLSQFYIVVDYMPPAEDGSEGGGANGFFYRQKQLVKKLNNLGNPNFVDSPTPPAGFGGPEYFGGGSELLDWDQLSAVCIVHDEYISDLYNFDVVELMAENFAHLFGVSEEFILDIIVNGTYCEPFYSARVEDERIAAELLAAEEQRKYDELMALYNMYQPKTVEMAVGEDGYPVSTDMVWNACIRNQEVYLPGEDKPVNCRRFHEGHTWTHPDTLVTFKWSDRVVKSIKVQGALVATHVVPMPDLYNKETVVVKDKQVERLVLETEQYMAVKADKNIQAMIVYGATHGVTTTVVLSDNEEFTSEQ